MTLISLILRILSVEGYKIRVAYYTKEVDYADAKIQTKMIELAEAAEASSYHPDGCAAWMPALWDVANKSGVPNPIPSNEFYSTLDNWLAGDGLSYQQYLLRGSTQYRGSDDGIVSSKYSCMSSNIGDDDDGIDLMDATRDIASNFPELGAFSFSFPFLFYDGAKIIKEEIVLNLIIAGCCVLVMCALLLGSVWGAVLVMTMVAMTDIAVLAFFYYSEIYYNVATAFYLVIAVGLTVDYSAHVCHSFLYSTGDRPERASHALSTVGVSVFHGGSTTFLAVLPLAFASSYVFRVQFQALGYVIFFGLLHGLVLLPVLLSLIGPSSIAVLAPEDTEDDVELAKKKAVVNGTL